MALNTGWPLTYSTGAGATEATVTNKSDHLGVCSRQRVTSGDQRSQSKSPGGVKNHKSSANRWLTYKSLTPPSLPNIAACEWFISPRSVGLCLCAFSLLCWFSRVVKSLWKITNWRWGEKEESCNEVDHSAVLYPCVGATLLEDSRVYISIEKRLYLFTWLLLHFPTYGQVPVIYVWDNQMGWRKNKWKRNWKKPLVWHNSCLVENHSISVLFWKLRIEQNSMKVNL